MQAITTIGLDIAKSVFQVHGVDVDGQVVRLGSISKQGAILFADGLVANHFGDPLILF
jgi:transposase